MGRGAPQGRRPAGGARGYDRADRLNELLVRILAEELDRIDDERMDEENTFKPEFVRAVEDALEEGDTKAVYELVEPLHPADIADRLTTTIKTI